MRSEGAEVIGTEKKLMPRQRSVYTHSIQVPSRQGYYKYLNGPLWQLLLSD